MLNVIQCSTCQSVSVSVGQSSELSIAPLVASSADWLSFRPHVGSSLSSHHQWTSTVPTADESTQPVLDPRWTEMKRPSKRGQPCETVSRRFRAVFQSTPAVDSVATWVRTFRTLLILLHALFVQDPSPASRLRRNIGMTCTPQFDIMLTCC